MDVHHVSASQLKLWKGCKAQWKAKYHGGKVGTSGQAADLGSALHMVLERWVTLGWHKSEEPDKADIAMGDIWRQEQENHKLDKNSIVEGTWMLVRWVENQNWEHREVISTEERLELMIPTKHGDVPLVYIIDRLDRMPGGRVDIVDYKSGRYMLNHDRLRDDLQAKIYAMAVWKTYPGQELYYVKFDYLRDTPIGVAFRPTELEEFWQEMIAMVEEIIETDPADAKETVFDGCRFCPISLDCETLRQEKWSTVPHVDRTPADLAQKRVELMDAMAGIKGALNQVDQEISLMFENDETLENIPTSGDPTVGVTIGSQTRRTADMAKLRKLLPAHELAQHATLSIKQLNELAEGKHNADEIRDAVKRYSTKPSVRKVESLVAF